MQFDLCNGICGAVPGSGDLAPAAFIVQGCCLPVREVLDRWYEGHAAGRSPRQMYFKVLAGDGTICILKYNSLFDGRGVMVVSGSACPCVGRRLCGVAPPG